MNSYASKFGKLSSGHRTGKVSFHSNPKEGQCQRMFKLLLNCTHLHASKVMLKILHARFQQYMNHELPDVQAGFRKGRGTRDQIANIHWIIEKARDFQKNIYFCFIDCSKAFNCVDHNKLWKILKEMGIPDHLTCFLSNLYTGQEATVRTGHGTTNCILSPCLFNLYAECVCVKLLSHVRLFVTPWTDAHQVPPSMGFSKQEYWSGLPFPSPGDLPDPGINLRSPTLRAESLPSEPLE